MTNHSTAQHLGAPAKNTLWRCKVCGGPFVSKTKGQQCCGRVCQVTASARGGWPGMFSAKAKR